MIKKAYAIQMSYDVSDEEKNQAEKAINNFNEALKLLNKANDHLNIMKTPFKNSPDMSSESVMKARAAIRRFRDKVIENFNNFKAASFRCINIMQNFGSDTQTVKLMKSFIASVDILELRVNEFSDLIGDLESKTFAPDVVKSLESIQEECDDLKEIIDDRIKNHIQSNILARSWVDNVSNELQLKMEQKTPLIIDLFNKRQDQLNESVKNK
jgi:hypothetical protein